MSSYGADEQRYILIAAAEIGDLKERLRGRAGDCECAQLALDLIEELTSGVPPVDAILAAIDASDERLRRKRDELARWEREAVERREEIEARLLALDIPVRAIVCPHCDAQPGDPCIGGNPQCEMITSHLLRRESFTQTVACPRCQAETGQPCLSKTGKQLSKGHNPREELALASAGQTAQP